MRPSVVILAMLALQTFLIIFLTFRVDSVRSEVDELAATAAINGAQLEQAKTLGAAAVPSPQTRAFNTPAGADADAIRIIVREELAAATEQLSLAAAATSNTTRQPERVQNPREVQQLRSNFQNELQTYLAQGSMTAGELASLEGRIAQLPPGERKRALGELSKAINEGRLEARF